MTAHFNLCVRKVSNQSATRENYDLTLTQIKSTVAKELMFEHHLFSDKYSYKKN